METIHTYKSKPNILFILIDDLGWRDLGCYGSSFYETPNIDQLADDGIRFTDAYASCPVCSPTRASIITGKYPARIGITDYIDWSGKWHPLSGIVTDAPYLKGLPKSEFTIAQALKQEGYRTWYIGKWHLGGKGYYPTDFGFDINIGGCELGLPENGYFSPWNIPCMENEAKGKFLTDHLTDSAINLLNEKNDEPFFLFLSHYAVHTPIQAPHETVMKYNEKSKKLKLDEIECGHLGEPFPTKQMRHLRKNYRLFQSDPKYAAMIENLDWNVGRLLSFLEKIGKKNNTIIIFTSDNGGLAVCAGDGTAPTTNLPLQTGKGWMYEGGIRVPLIIRWPDRFEPQKTCKHSVISPDLYPAILESAGIDINPKLTIDGVSFYPLLNEEKEFDRGAIFWHYPHYGNNGGAPFSAVRHKNWKLIEFYERGNIELYDLEKDISEINNIADKNVEIVNDLLFLLTEWKQKIKAKNPKTLKRV